MKIAVVGATGLVGSKMLQVLDEQHVEIDELIVAASERSIGKEIVFRGKMHQVISVEDAINARPDIAIFPQGRQLQGNMRRNLLKKEHTSSTTVRPGAWMTTCLWLCPKSMPTPSPAKHISSPIRIAQPSRW